MENQTLFIDDEISCLRGPGRNVSFDIFMLIVNGKTKAGDKEGVKYILQKTDAGYIDVECVANFSSGFILLRNVPVMVRGSKLGKQNLSLNHLSMKDIVKQK